LFIVFNRYQTLVDNMAEVQFCVTAGSEFYVLLTVRLSIIS